MFHNQGKVISLLDIPGVQKHLSPTTKHRQHDLWEGMLLVRKELESDGRGWVCFECRKALSGRSKPKLSLANNMWLGDIPHIFRIMTFGEHLMIGRHNPHCYIFKMFPRERSHAFRPEQLQRGLQGNITLYEMNTEAIGQMLAGQLMPHTRESLASVIGITLIGTKNLPKNWLKSTFRIRRRLLYEALAFLQANNPLFHDIQISHERLMALLEDGVPVEIMAIIGHEPNENIVLNEMAGYVPTANETSGDLDSGG
jgi:hypothetical protein